MSLKESMVHNGYLVVGGRVVTRHSPMIGPATRALARISPLLKSPGIMYVKFKRIRKMHQSVYLNHR